eukprot:Nitzschia sp. Nitz4//scaffold3_size479765//119425//120279//NITZ4_000051-RA/size479765-augustus-gene-0.12-mRNA-1//1//CDS//3329550611//6053//frame0
MKFASVASLLILASAQANERHHSGPEETDVESPAYCTTNSDGFGGIPVTDAMVDETLTTYYELTYSSDSNSSVAELILQVEQGIANYLLSESDSFSALCGDSSQHASFAGASPQAISITPLDSIASGVECESAATEGTECVVIEGGFMVYFDEDATDIDSTVESIMIDVETAMDEGSLVSGDIVSVTWRDGLEPSTPGDAATGGDTVRTVNDDNGSNTAIIVGASVGGILVLGLAAFYRRRVKTADDDTLTTGFPGSVV